MANQPIRRRGGGKSLGAICDKLGLPYTKKKGGKPVKGPLPSRKPPKA
jgi:hypothetical protein